MPPRDARVLLALGTLLGPPLACCVCATTPVRTPDGPRRLGDLRVGDAVWSIDVTTGAPLVRRVVARRAAQRECVLLLHRAGALICTPDHPLYAPESGEYEPAARWVEKRRETLLVLAGERAAQVPVLAAEAYVGVREVVDITLDAAPHNFVAGGVVVHNKSIDDRVHGSLAGPEVTLTPDAPLRRFELRACVGGLDVRAEPDASGLLVEVESASDPPASGGPMRYAVHVESGGEQLFVDRPVGAGAALAFDSFAGLCAAPRTIVFERLDERPDGAIRIVWSISADAEPPPGADDDADLELELGE